MQALNVAAEYRGYQSLNPGYLGSEDEYVNDMLALGAWTEDDGDYYSQEEWDSQYDEPSQAAVDNFRSWLDDEGDNYTGPTYPEYDD